MGAVATATAASAAPTGHDPASVATFEGRTIMLDTLAGWDAARVCVVSKALPTTACFRNESDATTFRQSFAAKAPVTSGSVGGPVTPLFCANPLTLYEEGRGATDGGRALQFCDTGYWQNLSSYRFDNMMSSYWTGLRSVHMAEHPGGGGYWYPGYTGPNHYEPVLANNWNDRVSSIFLY
jgi:hypothetical protein